MRWSAPSSIYCSGAVEGRKIKVQLGSVLWALYHMATTLQLSARWTLWHPFQEFFLQRVCVRACALAFFYSNEGAFFGGNFCGPLKTKNERNRKIAHISIEVWHIFFLGKKNLLGKKCRAGQCRVAVAVPKIVGVIRDLYDKSDLKNGYAPRGRKGNPTPGFFSFSDTYQFGFVDTQSKPKSC